mgnify:CR=1 FL=1
MFLSLYQDNYITSIDFNPNGETVATFDKYGKCLIADLNTDSYHSHMDLKSGKSYIWIFLIFKFLILQRQMASMLV